MKNIFISNLYDLGINKIIYYLGVFVFLMFAVLVIRLDWNNGEYAIEAVQKFKKEAGWCFTSFPFLVEYSMFGLICECIITHELPVLSQQFNIRL